MATASLDPPVPSLPTVILSLSMAEAETLRAICACIGGCPHSTLRANSDAIARALSDACVRKARAPTGTLTFTG